MTTIQKEAPLYVPLPPIPVETGCCTAAHLSEAFGQKVQPAAATRSETNRAGARQTEPKRECCQHVSLPSNSDRRSLAWYRVGAVYIASALALFPILWHCGIEMDTPVQERTAELQAVIEKFAGLRSAAHLRARLLRGLAAELIAAYRTGLTLKEIWKALTEHGYQGSYPQFCKTCGRIVGLRGSESRSAEANVEENLLPQKGERVPPQGKSSSSVNDEGEIQEKGKPAWQQQREEVAARLDREAEEYRRREASKVKPKLFTNQPFEPPR
jgi:hypothetical protein